MDSTEVHYLTYDPEEIFTQMHQAYLDAGGDLLYPGDEKEMLLRSVQAILVQTFAGVDNALRMATLRYACGEYLDIYGENRGCSRIQATKAEAAAQVTFLETGRQETFEAGTALTADGDMIWELKYDLVHSGAAQIISAAIVAREAGSKGNLLTSGTQMQLMSGSAAISTVYASQNSSGGNDAETDEEYRARIREYGLAAVTTGPADRYESAAMAASSRVEDAQAVKTSAGEVAVYLLIGGSESTGGVISTVNAALNDRTARPLTDHVTVSEAAKKEYVLAVQYVPEGSDDISSAVSEAVNGYKEWQGGKIGRAFNPDRLTVMLYNAGCKRVTYKSTSKFDNGQVKYTEISAGQVCSGTVTIEEVNE